MSFVARQQRRLPKRNIEYFYSRISPLISLGGKASLSFSGHNLRASRELTILRQTKLTLSKKVTRFLQVILLILLMCTLLFRLPFDIFEDGNFYRFHSRIANEFIRSHRLNWHEVLEKERSSEVFGVLTKTSKEADGTCVFVISLTRLKRRERLLRELKSQNTSFTLVHGIDGASHFQERDVERYGGTKRKSLFLDESGAELLSVSARFKRMEFGCYLSHVKTWELIDNTSLLYAAVLEDDATISSDFLKKMTDAINVLPIGWDLLYFNSGHTRIVGKLRGNILRVNGALGTYGYAISRRGAHKLLHIAEKGHDKPIDHLLDFFISRGEISAYQLEWPIVMHADQLSSTIRSLIV